MACSRLPLSALADLASLQRPDGSFMGDEWGEVGACWLDSRCQASLCDPPIRHMVAEVEVVVAEGVRTRHLSVWGLGRARLRGLGAGPLAHDVPRRRQA
jgi:hypothetical protein